VGQIHLARHTQCARDQPLFIPTAHGCSTLPQANSPVIGASVSCANRVHYRFFRSASLNDILSHTDKGDTHMKPTLLGIFASLILTACATAQTYTITDIGVLKGDNESSGFWIQHQRRSRRLFRYRTNSEGYPCTGTGPRAARFLLDQERWLERPGYFAGRQHQRSNRA